MSSLDNQQEKIYSITCCIKIIIFLLPSTRISGTHTHKLSLERKIAQITLCLVMKNNFSYEFATRAKSDLILSCSAKNKRLLVRSLFLSFSFSSPFLSLSLVPPPPTLPPPFSLSLSLSLAFLHPPLHWEPQYGGSSVGMER